MLNRLAGFRDSKKTKCLENKNEHNHFGSRVIRDKENNLVCENDSRENSTASDVTPQRVLSSPIKSIQHSSIHKAKSHSHNNSIEFGSDSASRHRNKLKSPKRRSSITLFNTLKSSTDPDNIPPIMQTNNVVIAAGVVGSEQTNGQGVPQGNAGAAPPQQGVSAAALGIPPASAQARLRQAKKDRVKQLKEYHRREKEDALKAKKQASRKGAGATGTPTRTQKIKFIPSIVLLEAAARNDLEEVQRLLAEGIDPNSCNEDGLTALHQCCIDHYPQMMKLLVDGGADVNATDSELWTPLHAAATCNHLDLVQYLIANGADLLAVNSDGNMPYDICEETQPGDKTLDFIENAMASRGITQQMIDEKRAMPQIQMHRDLQSSVRQGYDVNLPREGDMATALHIASANCYVDVVAYLLEDAAVDLHVKDKDGWQPIHAACCWCHLEVALLLIEHGASLETVTNNFETALDLCDDPDFKMRLIEKQEEVKEQQKAEAEAERLKRATRINNAAQSGTVGSASFDNSNFARRSVARDSLAGNGPPGVTDPFRRQGSRRSFRSSVRRSSMREKKDLQKKDMKEEFNTVSSVDEGQTPGQPTGSTPSPASDTPSSGSYKLGEDLPQNQVHSLLDRDHHHAGNSDLLRRQIQQQQSYPSSQQRQQPSYGENTSSEHLPPHYGEAMNVPPPNSNSNAFHQHPSPPYNNSNNANDPRYMRGAGDAISAAHMLNLPEEFRNSNMSSSAATTDPYSQQHITNGSRTSPNNAPTTCYGGGNTVPNVRQNNPPPGYVNHEQQHSIGHSSGTLSELKQKRVQERNQSLMLTSSGTSPRTDIRNQSQLRPDSQPPSQGQQQVQGKTHFQTTPVSNNTTSNSSQNQGRNYSHQSQNAYSSSGTQGHMQQRPPQNPPREKQMNSQSAHSLTNSLDTTGYPRMTGSMGDLSANSNNKQQNFSQSMQLMDGHNTGSLRDQEMIGSDKKKKNKDKACRVM